MAGVLDSELGSELLASYEAELKLVRTNLSQKLDQIPELAGESRKAAVRAAEKLVEDVDGLIGQLRLEVQNIQTSSRPKVNTRIRNYATEADAAKRKLKSLADDRSALFGERYSDNVASDAMMDQRQQLLSGTDRLERTSHRLTNIQQIANDTEMTGAGTLAELRQQREVLIHTGDMLGESEGYLNQSVKTLKGMARRMATNRIITVAIITILVILIFAVIASKFR